MPHLDLTPEKLVNSAQLLIPFYPIPTPNQIDDILAALCKTFSIPFTTESDAKALWRKRVGLRTTTPDYNDDSKFIPDSELVSQIRHIPS